LVVPRGFGAGRCSCSCCCSCCWRHFLVEHLWGWFVICVPISKVGFFPTVAEWALNMTVKLAVPVKRPGCTYSRGLEGGILTGTVLLSCRIRGHAGIRVREGEGHFDDRRPLLFRRSIENILPNSTFWRRNYRYFGTRNENEWNKLITRRSDGHATSPLRMQNAANQEVIPGKHEHWLIELTMKELGTAWNSSEQLDFLCPFSSLITSLWVYYCRDIGRTFPGYSFEYCLANVLTYRYVVQMTLF
jgi:hypothetical protein